MSATPTPAPTPVRPDLARALADRWLALAADPEGGWDPETFAADLAEAERWGWEEDAEANPDLAAAAGAAALADPEASDADWLAAEARWAETCRAARALALAELPAC